MGAPFGNKRAAKGKEWADQLKWALENYTDSAIERGQALRAIATKVVEQALSGDKDARSEIANRLDGKPTEHRESVIHQTVEHIAVQEADSRIAELLESGQDRDTAPTLPH